MWVYNKKCYRVSMQTDKEYTASWSSFQGSVISYSKTIIVLQLVQILKCFNIRL